MKSSALGLLACLAVSALVAADAPKPEAAAPAAHPKEKENPLHLTPARRTAAGLTLAKPSAVSLTPELAGYGRVLDPVPFITLVAELETARVAATASEQELNRTKKLFEAGANSSAQSVETATAAAARDRIAVASARARLIATWSRPLADAASLALTVDALEAGRTLARVDLTPGDVPAPGVKSLRVGLLGGGDLVEADVIGAAPTADSQLQGTGFLVALKDHPLPVGAALRAVVAAPGAAEIALTVPRSAIVYHQGSSWIYVLGEEDTFERKLVILGRSLGDRVALRSGVEESEQVLVTGAQQLLSAELQAGGAPEEP
ncbi:MAG: hypothetical protein NTV51_18710 [Verrucomicrobia bacterium]|nr:hypothetical protein [Verrucomicrobiota bacterium]